MSRKSRRRRTFTASPPMEEKALDLTSWPADLILSPTASGVEVNSASALGVPAVANAVSLISGALATLPFDVYEHSEGGGKTPATDHPAYDLVAEAPNDWTSSFELRRQLALDALTTGNAFGFVVRVDERPVEVIRLLPGSVQMFVDVATGEPSYKVSAAAGQQILGGAQLTLGAASLSEQVTYSWRDIIHVKSPISLDGFMGASPIALCREAVALSITMEAHAARTFGNGARPGGLIKVPGKLNAETSARMKASWQSAHGGAASGGTAILESGAEFQSIALTSVDAQFHEMRQFQLAEIARAFSVSPVLIGDMGRATWGNSEEMSRQFLQYTLAPWLRAFESAYSRVFLSREDRKTYSIEHDVSDLIRGDTATLGDFIAKMRSSGVMSANEGRHILQLPAHKDGDKLDNPYTSSANVTAPTKEAA